METRRSFIKAMGSGAALSALSFSPVKAALLNKGNNSEKEIKIGIIGAENSHSYGVGKLINVDKKFPGVKVVAIWGETDAFAQKAKEQGHIPIIVKDPIDMIGIVNAVIIDHRHPKYHLKAATPFVKAGIPTFVDKPFCYRLKEGEEFLKMARELGTPVSSFSTVAQSDSTFDISRQVKALPEYNNITRFGPADISSPYGGIFFYGVHLLQPLMNMFGYDIKEVKINAEGKEGGAALIFENGTRANLIFSTLHYGWETFVETKQGIQRLEPQVKETDPPRCYKDMIELFRTGKEPRSFKNILKCVAVLEAMERSVNNGQKWEKVEDVNI